MPAITKAFSFPEIKAYLRRPDNMAEVIALAAAAVFMFTGSRAAIALMQPNGSMDRILASTLLLNIALIFFAWGRHRDARMAMAAQFETRNMVGILENYDPNTQLFNRRSLFKRGEELVDGMNVEDMNLAMMVFNIKRFGHVNEFHGHAVGDAVLNAIADVLRDVVEEPAIPARLNGDEFAVLMPFA